MNQRHVTDQQHVLADLARQGTANRRELSKAVGSGSAPAAQPVQIVSHVTCNVYSVQPVVLGNVATTPMQVGEPLEAFNLAEPVLGPGMLSAGTYALMFRCGDKNAFYATP